MTLLSCYSSSNVLISILSLTLVAPALTFSLTSPLFSQSAESKQPHCTHTNLFCLSICLSHSLLSLTETSETDTLTIRKNTTLVCYLAIKNKCGAVLDLLLPYRSFVNLAPFMCVRYSWGATFLDFLSLLNNQT
jgi:hypothetical protein